MDPRLRGDDDEKTTDFVIYTSAFFQNRARIDWSVSRATWMIFAEPS